MRMLKSVIDINVEQPGKMLDLLRAQFADLKGVNVAVLGLAFKPDTDDVRESPAFPIMRLLIAEGAKVTAYDPIAVDVAREAFGNDGVRYSTNLQDSLQGADAALLVTRWTEFNKLPAIFAGMERPPLLIDGRRMLDKNTLDRYHGIGLG